MLRAELRDASNTAWLRLQGRFVGAQTEQVRALVVRCNTLFLKLVVDLSDVTFVDAGGEDLLLWLACIGAQFVANRPHSLHLCRRVRLPLLKTSRSGSRRRTVKTHY